MYQDCLNYQVKKIVDNVPHEIAKNDLPEGYPPKVEYQQQQLTLIDGGLHN